MNAFKLALSGAVIATTIAGGAMAASAEQAIPSRFAARSPP